jgi:hypothetical protein
LSVGVLFWCAEGWRSLHLWQSAAYQETWVFGDTAVWDFCVSQHYHCHGGIVMLYWHGQCTLWIDVQSYERCWLSCVFTARECVCACVYMCVHWINLNMGHPVGEWNHKCNDYSVIRHTQQAAHEHIFWWLAQPSLKWSPEFMHKELVMISNWIKNMPFWSMSFPHSPESSSHLLVVCSTNTK